jgi:hypothetical protein
MSFIRTIRKNVAAYRARKSAEHYSRQAFGIEQLEPRLLLTATNISAAQAETIYRSVKYRNYKYQLFEAHLTGQPRNSAARPLQFFGYERVC